MKKFNLEEYAKENFKIHYCQLPITKFVNAHKAIDANLIGWPDIESVKRTMNNFAFGSWFKNIDDSVYSDDIAEELASGKVLGQGLEALQFTFTLSGMSLHNSHALVRTRIGATFIQQSQAVKDFRHSAILVPPAFLINGFLDDYIKHTIDGKILYSSMLDSSKIAIDDARLVLAKSIPVWLQASYSLPSLLNAYSKRTDTQEEAYVFNILFEKMKYLICEKFPFLTTLFKKDHNCIHNYDGYRSNAIYKRDYKHKGTDTFTLHDKMRDQMVIAHESVLPLYYNGHSKVDEEAYVKIRKICKIQDIDDNL